MSHVLRVDQIKNAMIPKQLKYLSQKIHFIKGALSLSLSLAMLYGERPQELLLGLSYACVAYRYSCIVSYKDASDSVLWGICVSTMLACICTWKRVH